jgi:hypothetical protein
MTLQLERTKGSDHRILQTQRSQIKQELQQRIHEALQSAKDLPPDECLCEIKDRLLAIQKYCETVQKTFIMIEEKITCDQHNLGGCRQHIATLFRGPSEDASVAICVTDQGSLLHRNDCPWKIYRSLGDINPTEPVLTLLTSKYSGRC